MIEKGKDRQWIVLSSIPDRFRYRLYIEVR
jgi:hypothetical protein